MNPVKRISSEWVPTPYENLFNAIAAKHHPIKLGIQFNELVGLGLFHGVIDRKEAAQYAGVKESELDEFLRK